MDEMKKMSKIDAYKAALREADERRFEPIHGTYGRVLWVAANDLKFVSKCAGCAIGGLMFATRGVEAFCEMSDPLQWIRDANSEYYVSCGMARYHDIRAGMLAEITRVTELNEDDLLRLEQLFEAQRLGIGSSRTMTPEDREVNARIHATCDDSLNRYKAAILHLIHEEEAREAMARAEISANQAVQEVQEMEEVRTRVEARTELAKVCPWPPPQLPVD